MKFAGKVAWITGGASGIGRASAVELAKYGADIVVLDPADAAPGVVNDVESLGRRIAYVQGDVSKRADCERAAAEALSRFGRIDILLNNAAYSPRASLLDMTVEQLERTWAVILTGTFHASQIAARRMIEQGNGGAIIMISSVHANRAFPLASSYNAAKAGLNHMAATWAVELGRHGIRVNAIEPGWIDTPGERARFTEDDFREGERRILLGRLGKPEEMAKVVAFLASDDSSYITGSVIRADGGIVLPVPESRE